MGFSKVVYSSISLPYLEPAPPEINVSLIGSTRINVKVTIPDKNADGSSNPTLRDCIILLLPEIEEDKNPFENIETEKLYHYVKSKGGRTTRIPLFDSSAGKMRIVNYKNVDPGKTYWVAGFVSNEKLDLDDEDEDDGVSESPSVD